MRWPAAADDAEQSASGHDNSAGDKFRAREQNSIAGEIAGGRKRHGCKAGGKADHR
jgi:hypothetical protein